MYIYLCADKLILRLSEHSGSKSKIEVSLEECADFGFWPPFQKKFKKDFPDAAEHFYAQARRKSTVSGQNSSSGAVFENRASTFVHRRGGFGTFAINLEFLTCFRKLSKIIVPVHKNELPQNC